MSISHMPAATPVAHPSTPAEPAVFGIPEFCRWAKCGPTFVYSQINARRLRAVKAGRKTLIPREAAEEWLRSLPAAGGSDQAAAMTL
jgi:excisionase family DNA binding protein